MNKLNKNIKQETASAQTAPGGQVEPLVMPPKCERCEKSFGKYMPVECETIKYKTINGKIKTVYCCLDCQMDLAV